MAIPGAGQVHSELQRELLSEMKRHRTIDAKVTEEDWEYIAKKIDLVLQAPDLQTLLAEKETAHRSINLFISGLWSKKKARGPETPERLLKEAKSKESFAKWRRDLGGDDNKERALKAKTEAAALRDRAAELQEERRKAAEPVLRTVVPQQVVQTVQTTLRPDGTKRRRLLIIDVTEEPNGK